MRPLWFWVVTLVAVSLAVGCGFLAGAAVAGAGVYYVSGEASKSYPREVPEVFDAAVEVLDGLGVVITERIEGAAEARIRGRTPSGDEVKMRIQRQAKGVAKVKLRVGIMGKREYSQLVFRRIDWELGL